eukprot:1144726-Pelagomonas_calceolata.AAC.1
MAAGTCKAMPCPSKQGEVRTACHQAFRGIVQDTSSPLRLCEQDLEAGAQRCSEQVSRGMRHRVGQTLVTLVTLEQ